MKANNDPFIRKFNILDDLCKKRYPNCKNFDAIRKFANTLPGADKETLLSIIHVRNTIHDQRNLVSVNPDCLKFIDGLIKGLQSKNSGPIDADMEYLKSKNLQKMSIMMQQLPSKTYMASREVQRNIKATLTGYLEKEKHATNIDKVKKHYFDFCGYYNNIHNLPEIKSARAVNRERSLEKKRQSVLLEIEHLYNQARAEIYDEPFLVRGNLKKKLKLIFESYKTRVLSCNDFDDLDEILDDAEFRF